MSNPDICLIWAQNPARAIGRDNDMPWHSKKDFAHFRRTTIECPVIMGRRTWESLPRKPLPGRVNIVVSSSMTDDEAEGAVVVRSLEDALAYAKTEALDNIFVIGGATLYHAALPYATRIYRTTIHVDVVDADTFAPELGPDWVLLKSKSDFEDGVELVFEELGKRR